MGACSSSLRVPTESLQLAARSPNHDGRHRWKILPPHVVPRSPTLNKLLCRQVRGQQPAEANSLVVTSALLFFSSPLLGLLFLELRAEFPFLGQNVPDSVAIKVYYAPVSASGTQGNALLTCFHLCGCTNLRHCCSMGGSMDNSVLPGL